MRLSIVIPSNRDSLAAYARIIHACSWASDEVEVIVRDNSGSERKRAFLSQIEQASCRILFVEPCDAVTNFRSVLDTATGDFVLYLADDDGGFTRGVAAIEAAAGQYAVDPSVVGITGAYVLEQRNDSRVVSYPKIDSADVTERLSGYLGYQGPNLIFYSAVRRAVLVEAWDFILGAPIFFSFHDQFYSLIYLLAGRFIHVGRLTLLNDNANWEAADVAAQSDLRFYAAAGMDPATRQMHWLFCAYEGASIILNSRFGASYAPAQRQAMANQWFKIMFARFAGDANSRYDSSLAPQVVGLQQKWLRPPPQFRLDDLLNDIVDVIRLSSPEKAQSYHDFWAALATGQPT